MSKKFTSFLVLAALWLAIPAQGQNFTKKAADKQLKKIEVKAPLTKESLNAAKDAILKANDNTVGLPFTGARHQQLAAEASLLKAAVNNIENEKVALEKLMESNFRAIGNKNNALALGHGKVFGAFANSRNITFETAQPSARRASRRAEVVDANGIITSPAEGESKMYDRAGYGYFVYDQSLYYGEQGGKAEIVETADGVVYIKDFISNVTVGTWVKGTKEGNTITIPAGQVIFYNTAYDYGMYIAKSSYDEGNGFTEVSGDITLTVDGNTISLDNTDEDHIAAGFWTDNESFSGYGDYETVFSYDPDYVAPDEVEVTTGAKVDALPYANALNSADLFADFGVTDSNSDGSTWSYDSSYGTVYKWNSNNDANDWLISPAIKLEAGKKYHFAIDAKAAGASFPEKFEVKIGKEAKASALTQSVLAEVTVTSTEFVTYENENVSVSETGYYHFGIHATSDADQFRLAVANFLVEAGVEATAPDAVTDLKAVATGDKLEVTVSFKAPTKTVGGDDLTDLTKIDILRDGKVIKSLTEGVTPGAELSYVDNDEALTVGTHVYQVIPYNSAGIGVKSEEVSIFLSVALDVPYTFDLTKSLLDLFAVIDNNNDGKTWSWSTSAGTYYPYSSENAADDYLISLPFNLVAGKNYDVTVVAAASSNTYHEKLEVLTGKTATVEGLTTVVIPEKELLTVNDEELVGTISVEEDGQYYIAIHATSDADQLNLLLKSLSVELGPEPTAPAAIADFAVTPGAEGALEANLAFTAPSKAINGSNLSGTVDVKVYRDNELVQTLTGVAVGTSQTWKDEDVENGKTYTYYVVASNESGNGLKSDKVSVFVGTDALGIVENFAATSVSANNITFTWDPVAGQNGGYVNTAAVAYTIYSMHVEEIEILPGWTTQELVVDDALITVTGVTTATVDFNTLVGEQGYQYFGISATDGTTTTDPSGAYAGVLVGAPEELPIVEGFAGQTLHYLWDSNGGLGVDAYSSDEDGVALKLYNNGTSSEVFFVLPRVNLSSAANPTILFDALNGQNVSKIKVIGAAEGGEITVLGEFNLTSEYTTIKQSLNSIKGGAFASVGILATIPTASVSQYEDHVILDNIRIVDLYEYNLAASIKAPASVVAGQKVKVTATVSNEGENAAEGYVVTVKAGDKVLTSVVADAALAPFAKDVIDVDFAPSVFDEAGDVTLTVSVEYENELNPDDNTATATITVKEPTATAPASLLAENKDADGVDLTWTLATGATATEVTEDFDDEEVFEAFSTGGITKEQHTGEFGDWTLYDGNGIATYGFNGIEFPNNYAPMAFMTFNPGEVSADLANAYAPRSGEQFLISFCPADEDDTGASLLPPADHWLISPLLSGDAQTISFYARAITEEYGAETFEVWASTTDNNVASFAKVGDYLTDATEWTEFTAALSAGTKYFAIRHTSEDIFGLLIDDVTFVTSADSGTPSSFNIYLDETKIASVEGDKTTYNVAAEDLTEGEHTFALTAVYANGAESKPVVATVTIATDIRQIAAAGKAVDVYTLDGKLVRSQATSFDGLKGLYIVNGKAVMVK